MSKQRLGNTLIDYSSGCGGNFGLDKNLITTTDTLRQLHEEGIGQSKSQPSSHKKKKITGRIDYNEMPSSKEAIKKLHYNMTEDHDKLEEELKFTAQLQALNLNNKGNTVGHPSISKYTNNPYQATSTLSFYNKLSDSRELGE